MRGRGRDVRRPVAGCSPRSGRSDGSRALLVGQAVDEGSDFWAVDPDGVALPVVDDRFASFQMCEQPGTADVVDLEVVAAPAAGLVAEVSELIGPRRRRVVE